jgi:hypothetical protein
VTKTKLPTSERVIGSKRQTNARKRARKRMRDIGQTLRLSHEVFNYLNQRRLNDRTKRAPASWDSFFRRMLGLPTRAGSPQPLVEGWLELDTQVLYLTEREAAGAAVIEAARKRTKRINKPIKMREVRYK